MKIDINVFENKDGGHYIYQALMAEQNIQKLQLFDFLSLDPFNSLTMIFNY